MDKEESGKHERSESSGFWGISENPEDDWGEALLELL